MAGEEEGGIVENRNEREGKLYSLYKLVVNVLNANKSRTLTFNGSHDNSQHGSVSGSGDAREGEDRNDQR